MRFPIDVVFLDADLRVVAVRSEVRPWRVAAARGARAALELAAGEADRRGLEPGTELEFGPEPSGIESALATSQSPGF